ncbi:DUF2637 domain-containing protein, partial [Streptomyces sp. NPDC000983]|uniref:DUF2637 domain-containing protein n=1 Tax=Streptomyces sp. NPDC000983 TaxID=3154373 RepID=UPI0033312F08
RIADITADKHMEGVRLTRWMLSPVPTFLLWRRMKLWELRSYEQVIKLEQERLVYQARLRSRFGRSWRRKAPVESLMPLRLARYGVPLAETAPAGLAAAGIHPIPHPPPAEHKQLAGEPGSDPSRARPPHIPHRDSHNGQASASEQSRPATPDVQLSLNGSSTGGRSVPHQATRHANYSAFNDATAAPVQPHASGARWQPRHAPLKHTPTPATDPGSPASLAHRRPPRERAQSSAPQPRTASDETVSGRGQDDRSVGGPSLDTNGEGQVPDVRYGAASIEGPHTNSPQRQRPSHATTSDRPHAADSTQHAAPEPDTQTLALSTNADEPAHSELTQVDRYYQAWHTHQVQHGQEPTPEQLSTALTHQGIRTRQGQSVTPKALARYYLQFRLYTAWAQHRAHTSYPAIHHVLKYLTRRGITAQYNKPLTPADLAPRLDAFERRWHTLNHH